jgi:hypothetical protein
LDGKPASELEGIIQIPINYVKMVWMTASFREDPKFNGQHACPRCGSKSVWKAVGEEDLMINVKCEGSCRDYTMSYKQMSEYPLFIAASFN